jgi:hypothetical protein
VKTKAAGSGLWALGFGLWEKGCLTAMRKMRAFATTRRRRAFLLR